MRRKDAEKNMSALPNRYVIGVAVLMCFVGTIAQGCSWWNMRPPVARIQLKNGPYEIKDFVVVLDVPMQRNLDVQLNEHYALQLDLIFNPGSPEKADLDFNPQGDNSYALSPLVVCKYRF